MPLLRLNASPHGLHVHNSTACVAGLLAKAAHGAGPVIVMVHGYKYDPAQPQFCPHAGLFATRQAHKGAPASWPHALGFGAGDSDEGLAIAFGWRARGALWHAQRTAPQAGRRLAGVIKTLKARAPDRPVHVLTHSMGSEVLFAALENLPADSIARAITLTGASYRARAESALATPAGRTLELINITSRENDLFDLLFEKLTPSPHKNDCAIGRGIRVPNAVTLAIDCPETLHKLRALGGEIAPPQARICHWSAYTRPGVMAFYNTILRHASQVPLWALQGAVPRATTQRWARFFPSRASRADITFNAYNT